MGCLLDIDAAGSTASMRYTLNGMDMGVAFRNVDLAPPAEPSTDALFKVIFLVCRLFFVRCFALCLSFLLVGVGRRWSKIFIRTFHEVFSD